MEQLPGLALDLVLDPASASPLYRQIADALRRQIRTGRLAAGVKLPSSRALAKRLRVHRRTVVSAYGLLVTEGWVASGVGQGTFVLRAGGAEANADGNVVDNAEGGAKGNAEVRPEGRAAGGAVVAGHAPGGPLSGPWDPAVPDPLPVAGGTGTGAGAASGVRSDAGAGADAGARPALGSADAAAAGVPPPDAASGLESATAGFAWEYSMRTRPELASEAWRYWTQDRGAANPIRFMGATADPSLFPTEEFRGVLDEVFRDLGASALDYGPPEGYGPLREWVAERLRGRGVDVDADCVLIVSGSQQGLDLLARLLVREGEAVFVEEPGYTNGFHLFQSTGARTVGIPLDGGGLRLDLLAARAERVPPRLLYVMPIFQNPTGLCLAEDRRVPLLELCARRRIPVIEDQFDADLFYEGGPPAPLKAADARGQVVLLGSFSKMLFPGLRLGWMAVPRALLAPLRELKQVSDFASGLFAQCAMHLFCRRGLLDQHLERVRGIYGGRLRAMLGAMEACFPPAASWTRPRGGLTLWVTLPPGVDALELLPAARREGVDLSPGALFYPNGGGAGEIRLSWIREPEERIRRGIEVLGSLLAGLGERVAAAPASGPFF